MDKLRIAILCSGEGTTLNTILNSINCLCLNVNLVSVVSNHSNDNHIKDMISHLKDVDYINFTWNKENSREAYDFELASMLQKHNLDLVVLAGWNHILTKEFIVKFKNIINLHPALKDTFVGANCIRKAYDAYKLGRIPYTGSMVHHVIPEVDKGEVITSIKVPIYCTDTYEELESRQKECEKGILIQAIQMFVNKHNEAFISKLNSKVYNGKVRRVEDIGYKSLLMSTSNRLSAYDHYICDVPTKGQVLNKLSEWWFNNTRHIIDNHYLYSDGEHMVVRKTDPIKLEFVVRGYMTGSSKTSIWTMYNNGERNMYGINFRDGYKKNERLDKIILTPTTKGITDVPITKEDIIRDYLSVEEYDFISSKCLEIFRHGQEVALEKGLLLVDTKYEFGKVDGKIILIDEVHTCDSSRYWLQSSYEQRFNEGLEPEKLDKDCIRDWLKEQIDVKQEKLVIPDIPDELVNNVMNVYQRYYNMLTGEQIQSADVNRDVFLEDYFNNRSKNLVLVLAGSTSDKPHVDKLNHHINSYGYYTVNYFSSAHKNTRDVLDILERYENSGRSIVYVTVAGRSNALSGVVSCNTKYPVIACPPFKDKSDFQVNINSTLQCPSKVPVMTILEPQNVGLAISKIFAL